MLRNLFTAFMFCMLMAAPAHAEPKKFTFDKVHTQVFFFVNHLGFSNSAGRFLDFDGSFLFDQAKPADGSVDVAIKTDSLEMNDDKWNEHLKGKDFFNVAEFPTMTFKSTKVEMQSNTTAQMTGDLTMLGVTKPVTLAVTLNKCGAHPMTSAPTCGFSARGNLKRSDWGMKSYVPMVSDEVQLRIEVEASAEKEINQ